MPSNTAVLAAVIVAFILALGQWAGVGIGHVGQAELAKVLEVVK